MRDSEIREMPGELRSKRRIVVGLDLLDGERKMLTHLREEVDCGLGVVVVVNAENAEARGFVNGRELVEALACSPNPWDEMGEHAHASTSSRPFTKPREIRRA